MSTPKQTKAGTMTWRVDREPDGSITESTDW